jgi:hypothetical protein
LVLFFRKEPKEFFSEEKNQKTFASALAFRSGTWPERHVMYAFRGGFCPPYGK